VIEAKPSIPGSYRLREGFYTIIEQYANFDFSDIIYKNNALYNIFIDDDVLDNLENLISKDTIKALEAIELPIITSEEKLKSLGIKEGDIKKIVSKALKEIKANYLIFGIGKNP